MLCQRYTAVSVYELWRERNTSMGFSSTTDSAFAESFEERRCYHKTMLMVMSLYCRLVVLPFMVCSLFLRRVNVLITSFCLIFIQSGSGYSGLIRPLTSIGCYYRANQILGDFFPVTYSDEDIFIFRG